MCGICGELTFDRRRRCAPRRSPRCAIGSSTAVPTIAGLFVSPRRPRRPRLPPPRDHRPAPRRQPADGRRRTAAVAPGVQRRDLQLPRAARRARRSAATRSATTSDTEVIVAPLRRRAAPTFVDGARRHVRARHLGRARRRGCCSRATASARSRSSTRSTGAASSSAREIKASFAHPDVPMTIDEAAVPAFFQLGYAPHPATLYRGVRQVDAGGRGGDRGGRSSTARDLLAAWRSGPPPARRPVARAEARERVRALVVDAGRAAARQRRAARRVPQRRHRLDRRRRRDGAAGERAGEDVHDRLRRRRRRSTRRRRARPWPSGSIPTTRVPRDAVGGRASSIARSGITTARSATRRRFRHFCVAEADAAST